jgi:hypothetical protein
MQVPFFVKVPLPLTAIVPSHLIHAHWETPLTQQQTTQQQQSAPAEATTELAITLQRYLRSTQLTETL